MAIKTCLTTAGRLAFLKGKVRPEHVFKIALYTDKATLDRKTKTYTKVGEVVANGYRPLQLAAPTFSSNAEEEAIMTFPGDVVWDNVSISAAGVLIFDETLDNLAIAAGSLGGTITSTNDKFTLELPPDLIKFVCDI